MNKIVPWIKQNKLVVVLSLIIVYLVLSGFSSNIAGFLPKSRTLPYEERATFDYAAPEALEIGGSYKGGYSPTPEAVPQMDIEDRMVVTESKMSLLVKDVRTTMDQIQTEVETRNGYVVNTSLKSPEGLSRGHMTIRVPADQLKSTLSYLRGVSVRVVSENISGHDVTDQYVDIQARLNTLNKTKTIFEGILDKAEDVDEILRVQQRILNVQDQIDRLKGQLKYMEATSSSSLISIDLATDELALPYTPDKPWRPSVVFKYATRSLVKNLRNIASAGIWIAVYSIIWVPVLIVLIVVKRYWKKRKQQIPQK